MDKKFDAQFVVAVALGAAVAGGAVAAVYFLTMTAADDEDRPQIIVRGGSVDLIQSKKWTYDTATDKKKARPDHSNGANVTGFQVTFDSADLGGTASGCPTLPVVGDSVDVEYKPSATTSEHVTFTAVLHGSKNEPVISAPADMSIDNSGSERKLSHGASGVGSIASVTIKYSTATQTCTPNGGKFTKDITVRPLR